MKYAMYVFIAIAVVTGMVSTVLYWGGPSASPEQSTMPPAPVACTMDAMQCPDGSYVGRTGPNCTFVCPPAPEVAADVEAQIKAKADLITLTSPVPNAVITSPLNVTGQARGSWYSEASFGVQLVDWDGNIIATVPATATSDWMTANFVPFTAMLNFVRPYKEGDPDTMKRGTLILRKDNPSGLPQNDDALEIPVRFAQ